MDNLFEIFTPIQEPEKVLKYYKENNIPTPSNDYFKRVFETGDNDIKNSTSNINTFNSFNATMPTKSTNPVKSVEPKRPSPLKPNENKIVEDINNLPTTNDKKELLVTLAGKESSYDPFITNSLGYFGLYQFGKLALKDVNMSLADMQDVSNQHKAMLKLTELNEKRLSPVIDKFVGTVKDGVTITKNGILAAAHLLGASTVKDWFNNTTNTNLAKSGFKDANGTHILQYLKLFTS
jgi:hypothetical protein